MKFSEPSLTAKQIKESLIFTALLAFISELFSTKAIPFSKSVHFFFFGFGDVGFFTLIQSGDRPAR
jgi:hypothetical protein